MITYFFVIARHVFRVQAEKSIKWTENHRKFLVNSIEGLMFPVSDYYVYSHSSEPDLSEYQLVYRSGTQYVYQAEEGQLRAHYLIGTEISIICEEKKNGYYISIEELFWDQSYMYLVAMMLEKVLLESDALILHSAYIRYQDKAILFTAPSGTGKSTQADLWEKYAGCEIINGDRCVLQMRDGRWYACGFPICGSSDICCNEDTPIGAIVYLSQAADNSIEKLSGVKALRNLMSEISINYWDREAADKAIGLIENILGEIPFYHLACTKDRRAVKVLLEELGYASDIGVLK